MPRLKRWKVDVQLTPCPGRDRLTGSLLDSQIGWPWPVAVAGQKARLPEQVMLARRSLRPGVKLTWTYASQTGWLVHAQTGQVSQ